MKLPYSGKRLLVIIKLFLVLLFRCSLIIGKLVLMANVNIIFEFFLIFPPAIFVTIGIYWVKPFSSVGDDVRRFEILAYEDGKIAIDVYQFTEKCSVKYAKPTTLPSVENAQYKDTQYENTSYYYSIKHLPNKDTIINVKRGLYYYEYLITSGCIVPLRQKRFVGWEALVGFIVSAVVVLGLLRRLTRSKRISQT